MILMKRRVAFILTLLLLGTSVAIAQPNPPPAAQKVRLIMVLRQPGARRDSPKIVKEPDVTRLGGSVISRRDNIIEITIPFAAAKQLVDDENVAYVQRVWLGEPLDTWVALTATATPSSKLKVHALETGTDLTWASGTFAYDGSGNIKKIGNDDYVYDSALRLIQAVVHGTTETYKYDSFGNLKEKTFPGSPAGVIPVDPGSNRISGVSYDAIGDQLNDGSGNRVHYVYDAMGMMTGVTGASPLSERRMIYTADDERIGIQVDSTFMRWRLRDFTNGQVLREWSSSSGMSWQWVEDFVYGDGKLVAGETEEYQGGRRHYSLDHLGSVRMITSQGRLAYGRHDYYPFGIEQTSPVQTYMNFNFTPPEPMKFAGHERDYLGYWDTENTDYLDDMHARYYNSNVGRFLSVDPTLDLKKTLPSPQMWNRYSYVVNNPVRYTDPDGREHVNEPGFTKSLSEADWSDAPPVIQGAFYAEGLLLGAAAAEGAGLFALGKEGVAAAGSWALGNLDKIQTWGQVAFEFLAPPGPSSLTSFEQASNRLANQLQFTSKTLNRMTQAGRMVPRSILAQAIMTGARSADPQGAKGAIQITQRITRSGKAYLLQIIYREKDKTILHFHYAIAK
jgi:RHS repeat-associated protein